MNYVLLPSEIHVLVRADVDDEPVHLARRVGSVIARWVNESQPSGSPPLAGRYRSWPLLEGQEFRQDTKMLAWRPVALGEASQPTYFASGALRVALGLSPAQGFDPRPLLALYGDSLGASRSNLRTSLMSSPSRGEWRLWELCRGMVLSAGGPTPVLARTGSSTQAAALLAASSDGISGAIGLLELWIAAKIGCPLPQLRASRSAQAVRARALVGCLAVQFRLCSGAAVARHLGRSKSTLFEQMSRCRARRADQGILGAEPKRIVAEALALAAVAWPDEKS